MRVGSMHLAPPLTTAHASIALEPLGAVVSGGAKCTLLRAWEFHVFHTHMSLLSVFNTWGIKCPLTKCSTSNKSKKNPNETALIQWFLLILHIDSFDVWKYDAFWLKIQKVIKNFPADQKQSKGVKKKTNCSKN